VICEGIEESLAELDEIAKATAADRESERAEAPAS
jgi:hypothetical protein